MLALRHNLMSHIRSSYWIFYATNSKDSRTSVPIFLNAMIDVVRRKFVAVSHLAKRLGEVPDVRYLVNQYKQEIEIILMDKLYDPEKLHRDLKNLGIFSIAPVKKNLARGQLRKQLRDYFDYALYWQRNIVECMFSALKRLFATTLSSTISKTQRDELYMRMIAYNLGAIFFDFFY